MTERERRRERIRPLPVACCLLPVAYFLAACSSPQPQSSTTTKKLVILGIDGMDFGYTRKLMDGGQLPNLKGLLEKGAFLPMETSIPPQSPVAWSNVITGQSSKHHGIYDFVHRDPHSLLPYLSTSRTSGPGWVLPLGPYRIPLAAGKVELLRAGRAFWEILEEKGIPATVFKIPANFPPNTDWGSRTLSGMGTPDILGTYGTFHVFSTDPELAKRKMNGGIARTLSVDGQYARSSFLGPPHPLRADGKELEVPLELVIDETNPVALIRVGDEERILEAGEWSDWVPLSFDVGITGSVPGMVRLYLKSLGPQIVLYASPINVDPLDPYYPISSPAQYATEVARDVGRYYTQGMPEDTKALTAGVLTRKEFLAQAALVLDERKRLLDHLLEKFDTGVLFFYFSSIDQTSHMFWRSLDPEAPQEMKPYAAVLPNLYHDLDRVVGAVQQKIGKDTPLIVMSDHGFAQYKYKFNLNTWLARQGYLAPADEPASEPLGHIDWTRTQAYGLGINALYLNQIGREKNGIVDPDERDVLLGRLARDLEAIRDPETGTQVVVRTHRPEEADEALAERAPDLIIGYNVDYRASDESAMGELSRSLIEPNEDQWNGDHCMEPALVPGVLFSNRPIVAPRVSLLDLAPAILGYFGVTVPDSIEGHDFFSAKSAGRHAAERGASE